MDDGGQLLVSRGDIHLVSLDDAPAVRPLVADDRNQGFASLSPNDRWIAYESNESDTTEIYVRPFPDVENDRILISSGGGMRPLWNPNGRELHFLTLEGRLMTVPVEIDEDFEAGIAEPLWADDADVRWTRTSLERNYDIDMDGERFLIVKREGEEENAQARFDVVLNWFHELTERVPTN